MVFIKILLKKHDNNGFDSYGIHINTNDKYNPRDLILI